MQINLLLRSLVNNFLYMERLNNFSRGFTFCFIWNNTLKIISDEKSFSTCEFSKFSHIAFRSLIFKNDNISYIISWVFFSIESKYIQWLFIYSFNFYIFRKSLPLSNLILNKNRDHSLPSSSLKFSEEESWKAQHTKKRTTLKLD